MVKRLDGQDSVIKTMRLCARNVPVWVDLKYGEVLEGNAVLALDTLLDLAGFVRPDGQPVRWAFGFTACQQPAPDPQNLGGGKSTRIYMYSSAFHLLPLPAATNLFRAAVSIPVRSIF